MRWLEENVECQPFFLYVDTFDPHEPWDPPQWYVDLYDPGYQGEEVIYPQYAPCDFLSEAEVKHCRALYAGEVTMVDAWVGKLLNRLDDLGLREDTRSSSPPTTGSITASTG
jgi:arylsulfatase A-like enzyme